MGSNVIYRFENGIGYGTLKDGTTFLFDEDKFDLIKDFRWYRCGKGRGQEYIMDHYGVTLHNHLFSVPKGYELDHISLDTFDNRSCNVRVVTHQQNQINQPLQCNNTSGYSGVDFHKGKNRYRARLKINQQYIGLGYYTNVKEAAQARNVAIDLMFGEYGRKNEVEDPSFDLFIKVNAACLPYISFSQASKEKISDAVPYDVFLGSNRLRI